MGQQQVLEMDDAIVLTGLDEAAAGALFAAMGAPPLSHSTWLHNRRHARQPSPAAAHCALRTRGDEPMGVLAESGRVPSMEALLHRIWRRMDESERSLALQLAVFRTPAPADAWASESAASDQLAARGAAAG